MMPDLGAYAASVLSSYAVTLGLLGGIVALTWRRSRTVKRHLAEAEREAGRDG